MKTKTALTASLLLVLSITALSTHVCAKAQENSPATMTKLDTAELREDSTVLGVEPETQYKSDAAIESFGNSIPTAVRDKLDYNVLNPLTPCDDDDAVCGYAKALQANDYVAMDKWAKDPTWSKDRLGQISLLGLAGSVAIKVCNKATTTPEQKAEARKFLGQIAEDLKNAAANLAGNSKSDTKSDINSKVLTIVQDVVPIWQAYSQGPNVP